MRRLLGIFLISFKLGCTSFGGLTAHLAYCQNEYIRNWKWLTDDEYSNLVALSQFLPGPTSCQDLRGAMIGVNAAVVGILAGAILHPIMTQTIKGGLDSVIAIIFLWLLIKWNIKPYMLIALGIVCGAVLF